jgi:hypothetical protein
VKSERRHCMELRDQCYFPAPLPLERSSRNRLGRGFGGPGTSTTRVGGSDCELHVSIVLHIGYAEWAAVCLIVVEFVAC